LPQAVQKFEGAAVPSTRTIAAIKKWMYTTADLARSEQLFDGLRLAGVKE
jgi:hypothetical protein